MQAIKELTLALALSPRTMGSNSTEEISAALFCCSVPPTRISVAGVVNKYCSHSTMLRNFMSLVLDIKCYLWRDDAAARPLTIEWSQDYAYLSLGLNFISKF